MCRLGWQSLGRESLWQWITCAKLAPGIINKIQIIPDFFGFFPGIFLYLFLISFYLFLNLLDHYHYCYQCSPGSDTSLGNFTINSFVYLGGLPPWYHYPHYRCMIWNLKCEIEGTLQNCRPLPYLVLCLNHGFAER